MGTRLGGVILGLTLTQMHHVAPSMPEMLKSHVLLLTVAASSLRVLATIGLVQGPPRGPMLTINYAVTWSLYVVLIVPAALSRRRGGVAALIGLHVAIYLALAGVTLIAPELGAGRSDAASAGRASR